MTPNRKNLLTGILVGLFLAIAIYYFRATISAQAPSFLIGFLTCLALITSLVIVGGVWFKDQIAERFLGKRPKEAKPADTIEKTLQSLAQKHLPDATDQDVKSGVRMIQSFLWGRAVYTFLGVLVSIFLVMGGLIGSVLVFRQNELTAIQTNLIAAQNKLLDSQDKKLGQQNKLFDDQNKAVVAQTGLLYAQDSLFRAQNDFLHQQTELFGSQVLQIDEQNRLFDQQIGQTKTEIGLLRAQDSLFRSQNDFIQEQTKLFGTQVTQFDEQNRLLLRQDSLTQQQIAQVQIQNELLQNQIYLSEAERRSSLNFLLGNLLDQINRELKGVNPRNRSLSNETIGRIIGLSKSFKPYRYLQGDTLTDRPLSPERGQLLIALVNSNLSKKTYQEIFYKADFSSAELKEVAFDKADLHGAMLIGADFRGAVLHGVDLSNAELSGADFRYADLSRANLSSATLNNFPEGVRASLSPVEMVAETLVEIGIDYFSDHDSTVLNQEDLRNTDSESFRNQYLKNRLLRPTRFGGAILDRVNFSDADLRYADLSRTIDLTPYQLASAASIDGVTGIPKDWPQKVELIKMQKD